MKSEKMDRLVNPFMRIAGSQALMWGSLGMIDVYGTVLFAQLPFLVMNLICLLPSMQAFTQMDPATMTPAEMMANPGFHIAMFLT